MSACECWAGLSAWVTRTRAGRHACACGAGGTDCHLGARAPHARAPQGPSRTCTAHFSSAPHMHCTLLIASAHASRLLSPASACLDALSTAQHITALHCTTHPFTVE